MKKLSIVAGIFALACTAFAHTSYTGYSGAPGSSGSCAASCHGSGGGTIQIGDFPSEYIPGQTYTITISHNGGNSIRQFNGSCRIGTGSQNAGVITSGTNTSTYSTGSETNGIHFSSSSQNSGTFNWTAPAAGTGDVRLYIAGLQGSYGGANSTLSFLATEQVSVAFRKAPYLIFTGSNSEMPVLWQLSSTAVCTIAWGTDLTYSLGNTQTSEYGQDHQHAYAITGLTPGTTYYYKVTTPSETMTGSFRTAPLADAAAVKFLAYGNPRTNPSSHDQVAEGMITAMLSDPAFQTMVTVTGDLVDDGTSETDWDEQLFDPSYTYIKALLANAAYQSAIWHDLGTATLFEDYFPYPYVDDHYWSYDYGPVHFAFVDQYADYSSGSAQIAWLENDLASTDKTWKIIVLHEPGWSAGTNENNTQVQDVIQPLCEQYQVALVLAGHNNYYARAVVNDVTHVTTGGGGATLDNPNSTYPNVVATAMEHHFCAVTVDGDMLHFEAIDGQGALLDSFTIDNSVPVVGQDAPHLISEFALQPAYPNPFNPVTTLSFALPQAGHVELAVYDLHGSLVQHLAERSFEAGHHAVTFDGSNLSSGIYYVRLEAGDYHAMQKVVLMK